MAKNKKLKDKLPKEPSLESKIETLMNMLEVANSKYDGTLEAKLEELWHEIDVIKERLEIDV